MRRDAQGLVLLVVGAALLKVCASGSYTRYLPAGYAPVLVVTACVVLVIGAVALRRSLAALRVPVADAEADDAPVETPPPVTAEPDEPVRKAGWALLAAALVAVLLVPPAAGAYQAARTPVAVSGGAGTAPLPAGDPVPTALRDYVDRAVAGGQSLQGRMVRLSGFVVLAPDGRPYLARMTMDCCAADARPIEVGLLGNLPAGLVPDEWLEVDGTYLDLRDRDPVSRAVIPYVNVSAVRGIAVPERAYE
jgi:putative membrane protein